MPCHAMPCHAMSLHAAMLPHHALPSHALALHPAGRGGSCELMIGCIAKAASSELRVDPEEMEEVRWVSREGEQARQH